MPTGTLNHLYVFSTFLLGAAAAAASGCSSSSTHDSQVGAGGSSAGATATGSGGTAGSSIISGNGGSVVMLNLDAGMESESGAPDAGKPAEIFTTLPPGFTASQSLPTDEPPRGGYKLIGPLADVAPPASDACANILRAVVRDFQDSHVDFGEQKGAGMGFLLEALGDDRKPVLNPVRTAQNDIMSFGDWYHNVDGVNLPFVVDFWIEPVNGTYIFSSGLFFPLDGVGYPETAQGHDGKQHSFLFTTELHTAFTYKGAEKFLFRGDDDVWVFINGHLVVDLGGVHGPEEGSVDLDAQATVLGITIGTSYNLDLFHAERKPAGSNFRLETTLDFTGCGVILPGDVVVK